MNYIYWLTLWAWVPTAIIWIVFWRDLIKYKKTLLITIAGALIFSYPWDFFAIKYGIWYFPAGNNLGIWFLGLPLEEYFFITFVTLYIASIVVIIHSRYKKL